MNNEQYQQGRNALITTLNWTSESIDEFARLVLMQSVREGGKGDLVLMLNEYKSEIVGQIDNYISEVEGVK